MNDQSPFRHATQQAIVAVENADEEFFGRLSGPALAHYKSLVVALIDGNDVPTGARHSVTAGRRFWIGVASRDQVNVGVKGGFIQLNHGKKAAVQQLKAGDGVIMYSPRTAYPDGEPLQVPLGDGLQIRARSGSWP